MCSTSPTVGRRSPSCSPLRSPAPPLPRVMPGRCLRGARKFQDLARVDGRLSDRALRAIDVLPPEDAPHR
jgi:hypothetical protein